MAFHKEFLLHNWGSAFLVGFLRGNLHIGHMVKAIFWSLVLVFVQKNSSKELKPITMAFTAEITHELFSWNPFQVPQIHFEAQNIHIIPWILWRSFVISNQSIEQIGYIIVNYAFPILHTQLLKTFMENLLEMEIVVKGIGVYHSAIFEFLLYHLLS